MIAFALAAQIQKGDLQSLEHDLNQMCFAFHGRMGYSLKLLKTGRQISFNGDERFPSASTIKTAVMVAAVQMVDEGKLKWTDQRELPPMKGREASMWSYHFPEKFKLNLDGLVNLMITVSDNTATITTRDWLGTMNINHRMEALGLKNTKILGNAPKDEKLIWRLRGMFGMGMTTPNEMNRLFELIYQGKAASPAGTERMLRILGNQYWDDFIGNSVPPTVPIYMKSGAITRSRSDCALVLSSNPYILTIYTDSQKDRRWAADNEGDVTIRKAATRVWSALHPSQPYTPPPGAERFAPTGGGVEDS